MALVDDDDAELVVGRSWTLHNCGYAQARIVGRKVYMHRLILAALPDVQVDHVNRNGLDNRRANLRIATFHNNRGNMGLQCNNTSGYRGVTWDARRQRWVAQIRDHGQHRYLGSFTTREAAARAHDAAALAVFGEFASLNFGGDDR